MDTGLARRRHKIFTDYENIFWRRPQVFQKVFTSYAKAVVPQRLTTEAPSLDQCQELVEALACNSLNKRIAYMTSPVMDN